MENEISIKISKDAVSKLQILLTLNPDLETTEDAINWILDNVKLTDILKQEVKYEKNIGKLGKSKITPIKLPIYIDIVPGDANAAKPIDDYEPIDFKSLKTYQIVLKEADFLKHGLDISLLKDIILIK